MKRTLLAVALLATVASLPAQAPQTPAQAALARLGGTYLYDPAAKRPVLALTYRTATFSDVLGRKGLCLDLSAVAGASPGGASLGTALLWSREIRLDLARELRPTLAVSVGPALLYGTQGGRMRLGFVAGLGVRF